MNFLASHFTRPIRYICLAILALAAGCSVNKNKTPPIIPDGTAVTFDVHTSEHVTYALSDAQAALFLALINSPPSSVIPPDEPRIKAEAPAVFEVGPHRYDFHGSVHLKDADGYTFIWKHDFFSDHVWVPDADDDFQAIFEKMQDYDWPNDSE